MAFIRGLDPKVAMGVGRKITPKDTKEYVKKQLATNKAWAIKALLKVFEFQTKDEQEREETRVNNNVGFTGTDGEILTSFAKQYMQRGFLTPKQMILVYKKMPKYWNQIVKISDKNHLDTLIKQSFIQN
jgi:hypothetical protein